MNTQYTYSSAREWHAFVINLIRVHHTKLYSKLTVRVSDDGVGEVTFEACKRCHILQEGKGSIKN